MHLATKKATVHDQVIPISQTKRYWLRFFTNKTLLVSLIIFLICFAFIILSFFLYRANPNEPINNAYEMIRELPSELSPFKTKQLTQGDELNLFNELAKNYKDFVFIEKVPKTNLWNVAYNAYELTNDGSIVHILGTNASGIDIFARIIHTELSMLLLTLFATTIALFISTLLGIGVATLLRKQLSKFIYNLFGTFAIIPYLLLSVILFLIFKNSFINALLIFSSLSTIVLFTNAYNKTIWLLNQEFTNADIAAGFSKWNLMTKSFFKYVFNTQLILVIEHFSLIFMSYSAISIFSIDTDHNLLIGTTIKEALDLINTNPWYLITILIITTTFTFSFKFIAVGLNKTYDPQGENNAQK